MVIRIIQFDSEEYKRMIDLRIKALLEPIGVPAHYINPTEEKDDVLIGAFEEEEIIGCCILTAKGNRTVQLRQMAAHPHFQGRGIGTAIIQFAEQTARQLGFHTLMMHARNPVLEFYKKCGYEVTGKEFFEVGIGHHKMQKVLD